MIDIGAGTMDILYYDSEIKSYYKAVAKSPVLNIAEKIAGIQGNLLINGSEMGGGNISKVLKERARTDEVLMTSNSAATIHHNLKKVKSMGIQVIDEDQYVNLREGKEYSSVYLSDLEMDRIEKIIEGMGVPFEFDVVGICAQDHGVPPDGVSHLDFRHNIFKERLDKSPFPYAMLYGDDEVPSTMSRLRSIAECARKFSAEEVYVMDSGMAAIMGASLDPVALKKDMILVLDIATSHTVGAAIKKGEIFGFFEYHTSDITRDRLDSLLKELADGNLDHKEILSEGGHGAYILDAFGFRNVEMIVATGPKRYLIIDSKLPIFFGAPLGDNMMTGTAGLLESIRRKKRLDPFPFS